MLRAALAWSTVALVVAAAGCSMCASPYDYCGPTFNGTNCDACNPVARAGSILSPPIDGFGSEPPMPSGELVPTPEKAGPSAAPVAEPAPHPAPRPASTPQRWTARPEQAPR